MVKKGSSVKASGRGTVSRGVRDAPKASRRPKGPATARSTEAERPSSRPITPVAQPSGPSDKLKLVAVVIVMIVVVSSLAVLLVQKPAPGTNPPPPKPPVANDTMARPDVYISEVLPVSGAAAATPFVELCIGDQTRDLRDWHLTTFDNDSYVFPATSIVSGPMKVTYLSTVFKKIPEKGALNLDAGDELALYDSQNRLVDFLRWGGGNGDIVRGLWPNGSAGPYVLAGESVSRLDDGRFDPNSWFLSPQTPGEPNIYQFESSAFRHVLWVRSGRSFNVSAGPGPVPEELFASGPVHLALLEEAAHHSEFALKSLRRFGEPYVTKNTSRGAPVIEIWVSNRSSYRSITEASGRTSVDMGPVSEINSFACAREMMRLIELTRWGAPTDRNCYIYEGLAIQEAVRAAVSESKMASVASLWTQMRTAGLYNPYDDGTALIAPFIYPWAYDDNHLAGSWALCDYLDRRFVDSGLGASLTLALVNAGKEPATGLAEQMGRNLTSLFWDFVGYRLSGAFTYGQTAPAWTQNVSDTDIGTTVTLSPWAGWSARIQVRIPGNVEINVTAGASSQGLLRIGAISVRTGMALFNSTALTPGACISLVLRDVRAPDELLVYLVSGEGPASAQVHLGVLPANPSGLLPADGSVTNSSRPVFRWTVVPRAQSYDFQLSRTPDFLSVERSAGIPDVQYQPQSALPEGRSYWRVRAQTTLGNPTGWSGASEITVDTVPPGCYAVLGNLRYRAFPTDRWNVTSQTEIGFVLNGTAVTSEEVYYRFSENETWHLFLANFTLSGADGPRTLRYYSKDAAQNTIETLTLELVLDNTAPVQNISAGTPNHIAVDGDIVNISALTSIGILASDKLSGVGELKYRVDGSAWLPYAAPFNLSGSYEGTHLVTTTATDKLGNTNTNTARFHLDLSPPNVTLVNLTQGILSAGRHIVYTNVTDRCGGASVTYLVDGTVKQIADAAPFEWSWDTTSETDGFHTVEARARDGLGNTASAFVSVQTDNTRPVTVLALGEPRYRAGSNDRWNVTCRTNLTLIAADLTSGLAATWYTVDGVYSEGSEFFLTGLPNGIHNISYGSRDRSGNNESAQNITVSVDNAPPVPLITAPTAGLPVSGNISMNVTEQTGAGDVQNCTFYYSTDGVGWTLIGEDTVGTDGWQMMWNTTQVPNGNYFINAVMGDYLGNEGSSQIMVMVSN